MKTMLAILWARSAKAGERFRIPSIDNQWFTVDHIEREAIRNAQSVFTKEGRDFYFRGDCELDVELVPSKVKL